MYLREEWKIFVLRSCDSFVDFSRSLASGRACPSSINHRPAGLSFRSFNTKPTILLENENVKRPFERFLSNSNRLFLFADEVAGILWPIGQLPGHCECSLVSYGRLSHRRTHAGFSNEQSKPFSQSIFSQKSSFQQSVAHSERKGSKKAVIMILKFQFLGPWYVIQKTSTASKCIGYNYTRGEEPGEFLISQVSNHPVLGKKRMLHFYNSNHSQIHFSLDKKSLNDRKNRAIA